MKKQLNIFTQETNNESKLLSIKVKKLSYQLKFKPDGTYHPETIQKRSQGIHAVDDPAAQAYDQDVREPETCGEYSS